jgi:hypothetical protein
LNRCRLAGEHDLGKAAAFAEVVAGVQFKSLQAVAAVFKTGQVTFLSCKDAVTGEHLGTYPA